MKQTDFRDVLDELRERIEPLLAPFKRKRNGGSRPLSQRTLLAGILYKCRSGANGHASHMLYGSTKNAGANLGRVCKPLIEAR